MEDSDQTWGYFTSGENNPFPTQPDGYGAAYGGYLTAIMSPIQQADAKHYSLYNTDQTVYTKKAWHDFLVSKYITIGALNAAWGSNYTTFDSSATHITGASIGRTDGVTNLYTFTVPSGTLTPNSIRIYEDGTMIAGDCFHPKTGDACNPGNGTTWGAVWGAAASGGTVNYSTGVITVGAGGASVSPGNIVCTANTSCTAYFPDYTNPGVASGDHISVSGSTGGVLDLASAVVSASTTGAHTFSGAYCSPNPESDAYIVTYPWSGGDVIGGQCDANGGRIAKLNPLPAGHVLTVDYQTGGWDAGGTGLMDEDGRPSHSSWMGTDAYALSNANANTAADLRAAMKSLDYNYFSAMHTGVSAAFTNAGEASPMYLGPDSLGTWASTPPAEVLQAASTTVDLAIFGGSEGYTLTQSMINYIATNYGRPILGGTFLEANPDSPYSGNSNSMAYATQPARGAGYMSAVQSMLSTTSSSGVNPYVGFGWWQYGDNSGEQTNWGLVTLKDNAYDGHEAVMGSVTCSPPTNAYTCGGESSNYGNLISSIITANGLWLLTGR